MNPNKTESVPNTQTAKVGLYYRSNGVSSDPITAAQVEDSRRMVNNFLKSRGIPYESCVEFFDFQSSALDMDRPNLKALLRAVDQGEIDNVIAKDTIRFARHATDLMNTLERLSKNCVYPYFADGAGLRQHLPSELLMRPPNEALESKEPNKNGIQGESFCPIDAGKKPGQGYMNGQW